MLTILFRTFVVYVTLIATMRIMGKRQLGELEISELVTTLLISEIASLPIVDQDIPVLHAIIPLVTILTLEVILSVILLKIPRLKNLASARPSVLIRHGKIDQGEMRRIRISIDELISEIRQSGLGSIAQVDYAILEQNGKISIIPRKSAQPPDAAALGLDPQENGIVHVLIADGVINQYNMKLFFFTDKRLEQELQKRRKKLADIFFLGIDDGGELYWIDKEDT